MSQQALDLRRSSQIVWRYRLLFGAILILGIAGGGAYAWRHPPVLTSTALVVLPQPPQGAQVGANGAANPYTATQEVIAGSSQVLEAALPNVRPATSLAALRRDIQVGNLTPLVISITAKGADAADVVATANAVTHSYVQYVNSATDAAEHVSAQLLQPATNATGPSRLERFVLYALLGAVAGAVIGTIIALAIGRNDRRLRERDEIADSIGVPVLASFPVARPSDAAGWTKLLEDYQPDVMGSLQLRKALHHLGMAAINASNGNGYERGRSSVAILSLSSDPAALALGPQLATFAAAQGIPTALVFGPQQNPVSTASLRTACATPPSPSSKRPSQLRVTVSDDRVEVPPDAALTVIVAVVDGRNPQVPHPVHTTVTVLGVSSGAATAVQLARVAVSADADGNQIAGVIVANPESTDNTTGRMPQLSRPVQRRLPTRIAGMTTEIKR